MKKIWFLFSLFFSFCLMWCSIQEQSQLSEKDFISVDEIFENEEETNSIGTIEEYSNEIILNTSEEKMTKQTQNNSLVLYFSPTGNTKRIATYISEITNSEILELLPEIPYSYEDLNYNNDNSRANQEQNDLNARPGLSTDISLDWYDKIYVWYPIWRWTNPKLILTLVEKYNFAGKEIILFCTSWGSGIETSVSELKWKWLNIIWYKRFSSWSSKNEVEKWLETL